MPFLFWDFVALIGAGIHLARHKDQRGAAEVSKVLLMYWLALAMGLGSIFGAAFRVFDAKETAEQIGFVPWNPTGTGAFRTRMRWGSRDQGSPPCSACGFVMRSSGWP